MSDAIARLNAALEGRYAIERELGQGGMAIVYLADDLKHERKVALKVLKPELAAVVGAERFLAEIKTTATLHHPHILPLFDSGEADGFLFYVMPFLEGETLKERIDREKQLPVDEAVRITTAVAQALQHAHERGVIHRDIKPANILLQDGQPLVSDFGIALAVGSAGGTRLTETGLSVGTPFYMSPEQATGDQHVGPPSDVYALAAVLFEMLTGDPPYMGSTAQAVLGQIIAGTSVSATAKRRAVPAHVDAAIRKALEKLPADRFAVAQDFARALGDAGFRYGAEAAGAAAGNVGRWKAAAAGLAAVALLTTGVSAWSLLRPDEPGQVRRYELTFEEDQAPQQGGAFIDFTVDGSALVYSGSRELMMRPWSALEATPLTSGGIGAWALSPDGREFAQVLLGGNLTVYRIEGGAARVLGDQAFQAIWDWGSDGYIYGMEDATNLVLSRIPASGGGAPEAITELRDGEVAHALLRVLPGGRFAVFIVGFTDVADIEVWALDLESRERWFLTQGFGPRYSSSGHLLYGTVDGTLVAAPFDVATAQLTGPGAAVADGLTVQQLAVGTYAIAPDGSTLVYEAEGDAASPGTTEMLWVDRTGSAVEVDPSWSFALAGLGEAGQAGWALSPDGTRVALSAALDGNFDIWVKQLPAGPFERLTTAPSADNSPFWFPDGLDVGFSGASEGGLPAVLRRRADGTGGVERLSAPDLAGAFGVVQTTVSDDWIVARTSAPTTPVRDIVGFRLSDPTPVPLVASSEFMEHGPKLSPDGGLLAYSSDESGREEVYLRPFPEVDSGRETVSIAGGSNPQWAHSGTELFFVDAERRMNVARIETSPRLRVVDREVLFSFQPDWIGYSVGDGGDDFYAVDVDDARFLIGRLRGGGGGGTSRWIVVENWLEEVRDQFER